LLYFQIFVLFDALKLQFNLRELVIIASTILRNHNVKAAHVEPFMAPTAFSSSPFRYGRLVVWMLVLVGVLARAEIIIPQPAGPYETYLKTMELVGAARKDPYASNGSIWAVMISLFYPIMHRDYLATSALPYIPHRTAAFEDASYGLPNGTLESVKLQVCTKQRRKAARNIGDIPVVLYSPGLFASRLLSSVLAQSLTGSGCAIVTIDHPYDANSSSSATAESSSTPT
jgi:hypothetical protein